MNFTTLSNLGNWAPLLSLSLDYPQIAANVQARSKLTLPSVGGVFVVLSVIHREFKRAVRWYRDIFLKQKFGIYPELK